MKNTLPIRWYRAWLWAISTGRKVVYRTDDFAQRRSLVIEHDITCSDGVLHSWRFFCCAMWAVCTKSKTQNIGWMIYPRNLTTGDARYINFSRGIDSHSTAMLFVQSEKGPDLGRVAWGLIGIETKWLPTQPAAVHMRKLKSRFHAKPAVSSSVIWALLDYGNRQDAARKSANGAHQGLRSQSSTAFARDLASSENGFFRKSFVCQTRRSGESMIQPKKKSNEKKNTRDAQHFFRQAWHFCCTSHWPASDRYYCSELLLHLLSRRLSSGHPQGKWNGQTACKRELNTGT